MLSTKVNNKKIAYYNRRQVHIILMQLKGVEPSSNYLDMNLNHARMPIPPQLQVLKNQQKLLYLMLQIKSMKIRNSKKNII